jgi:hypothetical protein
VARRGSKIGIGFLVLVVIVGVVLVIADRVAAGVAADQISKKAKQELVARDVTMTSDPKVSIGGFPFLTQVIGGKYQKITIDVAQPKIQQVQLDTLHVIATDVTADAQAVLKGTGDVVAHQVTGTATISWANVRPLLQLAGLPKGVDPSKVELTVNNNQVQLKVPVSVEGVNFNVIAKGTLSVESGQIRVQLTDVSTDAGDLPSFAKSLIKQYQQQLAVNIKIPAMPFKLVVNKVETTNTGLSLLATASDVKLSGA